ncbi:MAG: hypothetical protein M1823_005909 [Watsoniomyces obsoletus]|nr:MAG: hypothetical protein M1823_005909 [Watsoniomyces obsoletus]
MRSTSRALCFQCARSIRSIRDGPRRVSTPIRQHRDLSDKPLAPSTIRDSVTPLLDHQDIATQQQLYITSIESPGSPLFTPHGAHIFNRLLAFLRAQHRTYGFQEVITPNIYKQSLWKKSGHWEKFRDDMFLINEQPKEKQKQNIQKDVEDEDGQIYGLKPMNCPGHCLLFDSIPRSYRQLPMRYADYGSLHRNERSGTMSGLTRLRRFHQDDGHIFCTPAQVAQEIASTLDFVAMVYKTFKLPPFRLVLSTRPREQFIGTSEEWNHAEAALQDALQQSRQSWTINEGDGAFYGPKIDIILPDSHGKEHQTATIQLDFQLPRRFGLSYQTSEGTAETPVIIHRAIYGSVERFMALLMEHYRGKWPFWLSPRQAIVLPVNGSDSVMQYATDVVGQLSGHRPRKTTEGTMQPEPLDSLPLAIDLDASSRTLPKRIGAAKQAGYHSILVVGQRDVDAGTVSLDLRSESLDPGRGREILLKTLRADGVTIPSAIDADVRHLTLKPEQVHRYFHALANVYE